VRTALAQLAVVQHEDPVDVLGEGIDDLVPFSADEYVDGLFAEKW